MIQSIIVYSFLMFTMILFVVYTARRNGYISSSGLLVKRSFWRFEVIFPLILFAIIFGMRYDVGVDHLGYLEGYLNKEYVGDRKSTRLNSSHVRISYAVFCLKKKNYTNTQYTL